MNLIVAHHLSKTYLAGTGQINALDNVSLDIDAGMCVAMMGSSGSGKTTLLSLLGGLTHPTRGTVVVDGIDIFALNAEQRADFRREYLGFVFQSFLLLPYLTVMENVMLPLVVTGQSRREQEAMAAAILERVGLGHKRLRLPDELSGGEQQRVAIARALVNHPPIILADEPTGNLDTATSEGIMSLIRSLNDEGHTVIMVTHNPDNLRYADRCIRLRDGRMIDHRNTEDASISATRCYV